MNGPQPARRVWIAGHRGMLGSALVRRLSTEPVELLTVPRKELDLEDQAAVAQWVAKNRPDWIIIAAAKVGGIVANRDEPASFIYSNLMIEANIIHAAQMSGVTKLLQIASSAIYPANAPQPIVEDALLQGRPELLHEPYSVAKIAGITMARAYRRQYGCDFISAIPTNLYGPGDNFDPVTSHVVPAIIRKVDQAKRAGVRVVEVWGTGTPRREFLHVDDLADALLFLMCNYSGGGPVNVGFGSDVTILELTHLICEAVGFEGEIVCDPLKPDGASRRLLDSRKLQTLGWKPSIQLRDGLAEVCRWYRENVAAV